MRYAILSDIHGNFRALEAVLNDASKQNIDTYLILGDNLQDFSYHNEVINTLRNLKNVISIKGNKEEYLQAMAKEDQSTWIHTQFAPMYWNYRTFTKENLQYSLDLPTTAKISAENGQSIYLQHSSRTVLGVPETGSFVSRNYLTRKNKKPFTHQQFLESIQNELIETLENQNSQNTLPDGVYTFGHAHLQWHVQIGNKLFINPGSCGLPMDCNPNPAYSIIEQAADKWIVEERRVTYDIEKTVKELENSELYKEAEIWCKLTIEGLREGKEILSFFFDYVNELSKKQNRLHRFPYPNEIWNEAGERWFSNTNPKSL